MKKEKEKVISKPAIESEQIWTFVTGMVAYPSMVVAYDLGLFELLGENALTAKEIGEKLKLESRPIESLLVVLTAMKLLAIKDYKYSNTEMSNIYLVKGSRYNMDGIMKMLMLNPFSTSIDSLKQSVLEDRAMTYSTEDIFDSHKENSQKAKEFTETMHSISLAPALYWPEKFQLAKHKIFLDIAGGSGAHTIGVLQYWPHLKGILFDIPPVCEVAEANFKIENLASKTRLFPGNMWDTSFPKADIHFYSQIFHDWSLEKCQYLSNKSFNALPVGGKILLHEMLLYDDKSGPLSSARASIGMLRWTEGKQYTFAEFSDILMLSGFENIKQYSTGYNNWSLVSGEKSAES